MERRRSLLVLGLLVALVLVVAVAGVVLLRDDGESDLGLAAFSTRGTPIRMEIPETLGPWGDVTGEAILIAERPSLRFLRLPRKDGSSCWATAEQRSGVWSLTGFTCEGDFVRFPDPKRPVMPIGRISIDPVKRVWNYEAFAGFAADGVKRIGVLDANGRLVEVARVAKNTFLADEPPQGVKRLAALDAAGEVIWRGDEVPQPDE